MELTETTPPIPTPDGPLADAAQRIAFQAHQGQRDESGAAYIGHPARVAARLVALGWPDEVIAAGWLHHLLEDTDWDATCLRAAGVTDETIRLVESMTRLPKQRNGDYYAGVLAGGPAAVAVKTAAIDDNTDPDWTALLEPAARNRVEHKYADARRRMGIVARPAA